MCVLQVYEEVEVPVVRLLANTLLPAVSLDAELLTQQLGQTQAALATAQAAASGLAFRAVDLDDRDSCMRALQSVQAVVPQSRPKARGPLSLMQLREVCEKAAAAGNLRAVQMGHFMLQHRQLRDRASHLQSLVETLHSGSASPHTPQRQHVGATQAGYSIALPTEQGGLQLQPQHSLQSACARVNGGRSSSLVDVGSFSMKCQADFGFMGPLDEQVASLFACSIEPVGADLSVSQSSLQDELLSEADDCKVVPN